MPSQDGKGSGHCKSFGSMSLSLLTPHLRAALCGNLGKRKDIGKLLRNGRSVNWGCLLRLHLLVIVVIAT